MASKASPQTAMDERLIEDGDLEKALEDREQAKGAAGEARGKLTTMDELVKGKLEQLGLDEDETVRCGRFRISKRAVAEQRGPYPVEMVELVRKMWDAGYRAHRIRGALERRGLRVPTRDTIKRWVDEDYAVSRKEARDQRIGFTGPSPRRNWRRRLDRIQALRELKLSFRAIAAVVNLDLGLALTEYQVRAILNGWKDEDTVREWLS